MAVPSRNGDGRRDAAHGDGAGRERVRRAVAALARLAEPPAVHRAAGQHRAAELVARHDAGRRRHPADRNENGGVVEGAVGELPELISPGALRGSVGQPQARVFATGRDAGRRDRTRGRERLRLADRNRRIRRRDRHVRRGLSRQAQANEGGAEDDDSGSAIGVHAVLHGLRRLIVRLPIAAPLGQRSAPDTVVQRLVDGKELLAVAIVEIE